mgnify:CR=1 FL=1
MSVLNTQPENVNYLGEVNFKLEIQKIPNVTYFTQAVSLPGVTLTPLEMERPLRTPVGIASQTLDYEELIVSFIVDEYMYNYQEIFNWIVNIVAPSDHAQFNKTERTDGLNMKGDRNLYSEIQISILSSKNNPVVRTTLHDTFPLNLSGLTYTTQDTDATYLTADVSFAYSYYEFLAL